MATAFDKDKFLETLLRLDLTPQVQPGSGANFAQFMAAQSLGVPDLKNSAPLIGVAAQEQNQGSLSKIFQWLGAPLAGTQQAAIDLIGEKDPLAALGHLGSAAATFVKPVLELPMLPGVEVPFEKAYEEHVARPLEEHTYYREMPEEPGGPLVEKPVFGASILESYLGVDNPILKYGGGFALDVLTDPLSYVGVGLFNPNKYRKAGQALESLATGVTKQATLPEFKGLGLVKPEVKLPKYNPVQTNFKRSLLPTTAKTRVSFGTKFRAGQEVALSQKTPFIKFHKLLEKHGGNVAYKKGLNPDVVVNAVREARVMPSVAPAVGSSANRAIALAEDFKKTVLETKTLSPAMQAALYKKLHKATASSPVIAREFKNNAGSHEALLWRKQETLRQLRSAEDHLFNKFGVLGQHWAGSGLRLSNVLAKVGPDETDAVLKAFQSKSTSSITNPTVRTAIEQAIGQRAVATGAVAESVFNEFSKKAATALDTLSPQKFESWLRGEKDLAFQKAQVLGLTKREAEKVSKFIEDHVDVRESGMLSHYTIVKAVTPRVAQQIARGKFPDPKDLEKIRKSISREVDLVTGKVTPFNIGNRVRQAFALNMTTWMGRGVYKNMANREFSVVVEGARARADGFSQFLKEGNYNPDEVELAFTIAQKSGVRDILESTTDPRILALSDKMLDYFENMVGSSRSLISKETGTLKALNDLDGNVAFRSGLVMNDVNRQLKAIGSTFQFKMYKDTGEWLTSWERVKPREYKQNPMVFLFNLDTAIHRVLAEYNIIDSFAMDLGKRAGEEGFNPLVHTADFPYSSRIATDLKFPQKAAEEFGQLLQDLDKGMWRPGSKQMQMMTEGLRKWKKSVTIYYPSHHERNLMGDIFLMWLAGHSNPIVFSRAAKVLGSQRKRYKGVIADADFDALSAFRDRETAGWAQADNRTIIVNKHGANISADEIFGENLMRGSLKDMSTIEDMYGDQLHFFQSTPKSPLSKRLTQPFGGAVHDKATTLSEVREHYVRIAHSIAYIEKHLDSKLGAYLAKTTDPVARSKAMKKLFDDATDEVNKFHPDGTDLTYFEQKYMRNIFPFYSWTRKAIPLIIEGVAMKPAKATVYPKGMFALQGMLGINATSPWDPFPKDQLFPDWITATGVGPLGDPESDNPIANWFGRLGRNIVSPFGQEMGYTQVNPGANAIPFNSIIADFFKMNASPEEFLQGTSNQLTPFAGIPMDLLRNRTDTGAPISTSAGGQGYGSYLFGQVPQLTPFQRTFGIGKEPQQGTEPGFNWEALINMLTAAGVQGTGKYTVTSQYQLRDRLNRLAAGG